MDKDKLANQILKGSSKAQKSYAFNEGHDPTRPAQMWFQESQEGLVLFVVFYSMACRWSRCLGCNLPSQMSLDHVDYAALMSQIDHLFADPEVVARGDAIQKVIVSNNGSVLDEATFSSTALMYLLAKLNLHLPQVAVLALESRAEYVDLEELEFISRALAEAEIPAQLELAIGFEAFDDHIRNSVFYKGLPLDVFEDFVRDVAPYKFHIKCYFMQKPVPGMTDEEAVEDIKNGIDYLGDIARKYDAVLNMHLNPCYVARGTPLEEAFLKGDYAPPLLGDVVRAARHARGKGLSLFIGLSDEGLAAEGGSFVRPGDEAVVAVLEEFNVTQDFDVLDKISRK